MVIKLIIGEIKEGGKNSSLYLEFLLWMLLRLLALSLIAGENRGWGGVCRRRVRDSQAPCFGRCIITQVETRCMQISLPHHRSQAQSEKGTTDPHTIKEAPAEQNAS